MIFSRLPFVWFSGVVPTPGPWEVGLGLEEAQGYSHLGNKQGKKLAAHSAGGSGGRYFGAMADIFLPGATPVGHHHYYLLEQHQRSSLKEV